MRPLGADPKSASLYWNSYRLMPARRLFSSRPPRASFRRVPLTTARNSPFWSFLAFLAATVKYGWRIPLS